MAGPLDLIPRWWHVGTAVAVLIATAAVTKADTVELGKRIEHIDAVGTTHEQNDRVGVEGRLARIEANQEAEKAALSRIENRLR